MPRYFDDAFLRRLRNDISWASLLNQLGWPHKQREGQQVFLCPRCAYRESGSERNVRHQPRGCSRCG